VNPKYFEAWSNLGIVYYNVGAEYVGQSNKVDMNNQAEYDRLVKLADDQFRIALEKFSQAYSINPKDKSTVEAMKNIYFRFRNENPEMKKKYDEFNELLQAL